MQAKYGNDYYKVAVDGSVTPTKKWVYDFHYAIFKKEFNESTDDDMMITLTNQVKDYNEQCGSKCATLLSHEGNLIVCICDPLMKMVHETLPSSALQCKHGSVQFKSVCPSFSGALPLEIVITFNECEAILTKAFEASMLLFPKKRFFGQKNPELISPVIALEKGMP